MVGWFVGCFCVFFFSILSYPRKQRPFEALNAGADWGKPFSQPGAASACRYSGIVIATATTTTPSDSSAATIAIIDIDVVVVISPSPLYGRKQRPFEALNGTLWLQPLASASCVILTTVTTTTPSNANAVTSASSASCCSFFCIIRMSPYLSIFRCSAQETY